MNWMNVKDRIITSLMLIGGGILIWAHWPSGTTCDTFAQERPGWMVVVAAQREYIGQLEAGKLKIEEDLKVTQESLWMARAKNIDLSIPAKRVSDYEKKVSFDLGQVERVEAEPITVAQPVVVPKVEPMPTWSQRIFNELKHVSQMARAMGLAPRP